MYIEVVPNRKSHPTILLRESVRVGKRVVKRTLQNLTHWAPERIEWLRRALGRQPLVAPEEVFAIERSLPHGHVAVVLDLLRRLGLPEILGSKRSRHRDLVLALLVERVLAPCSKLATTRRWHTSTLAQELGVADADEDELYAALDWLWERQPAIERQLAARHLAPGALALYDVSSSFYYGRHCVLAQYGHNRDGKNGEPIIVYGVLADGEGRPLAVDVFPGNTGDPATVPAQVEKLRHQFGLERVVLAGDRGMLTETQIGHLQQYPGLGWISCLRSPAIRDLVAVGTLDRSLFDAVNLAEIQSAEYPGERLIACFNPVLAEERQRKREALLCATEKRLEKLAAAVRRRTRTPLTAAEIGLRAGKLVNHFHVAKHFVLQIADNAFSFSRDQAAINAEAQLDGIYVIRTSEPRERLSAADAVRGYKSLAHVERVFRCLKSVDVRVRPIHLRTANHVRAHIFLCVLAGYVEWHLRDALASLLFHDEQVAEARRTRDPVRPAETSPEARRKRATHHTADGFPVHDLRTLLEEMATLCRNTCLVPGHPETRHTQLTQPTPLQARVFELLRRVSRPTPHCTQ